MTVQFVKDDLFELQVQAIVNPVNLQGVSGAGLAKQFSVRYPKNNNLYQVACQKGLIDIGKSLITVEKSLYFVPFYIINFPTKDHWKDPSKIEYIEAGLIDLVDILQRKQIESIALPALGCGLGKLPWDQVGKLIQKHLDPLTTMCIVTRR